MNAAHELSPVLPKPRMMPPRPTPRSTPPAPLPATPTQTDEVLEVSDTSVYDVSEIRKTPSVPPPLPASVAAPTAIERRDRAASRALVVARTFGFFVTQLAVDGARGVRALAPELKTIAAGIRTRMIAQWARASARARG